MRNDLERILLTEEQIMGKVKEIGAELTEFYKDKNPLVVCLLKGSSLFFTDLIRNMEIPMELDFMAVSSYGSGTKSSGDIKIKKDLVTDIKDRNVLLVEDIIDSGNTLYYLKDILYERQPKDIKIVSLLEKPSRREKPIKSDFCCFEVEDEFVVGYGMDYAEKYRNLPFVGILKRSVYEK